MAFSELGLGRLVAFLLVSLCACSRWTAYDTVNSLNDENYSICVSYPSTTASKRYAQSYSTGIAAFLQQKACISDLVPPINSKAVQFSALFDFYCNPTNGDFMFGDVFNAFQYFAAFGAPLDDCLPADCENCTCATCADETPVADAALYFPSSLRHVAEADLMDEVRDSGSAMVILNANSSFAGCGTSLTSASDGYHLGWTAFPLIGWGTEVDEKTARLDPRDYWIIQSPFSGGVCHITREAGGLIESSTWTLDVAAAPAEPPAGLPAQFRAAVADALSGRSYEYAVLDGSCRLDYMGEGEQVSWFVAEGMTCAVSGGDASTCECSADAASLAAPPPFALPIALPNTLAFASVNLTAQAKPRFIYTFESSDGADSFSAYDLIVPANAPVALTTAEVDLAFSDVEHDVVAADVEPPAECESARAVLAAYAPAPPRK